MNRHYKRMIKNALVHGTRVEKINKDGSVEVVNIYKRSWWERMIDRIRRIIYKKPVSIIFSDKEIIAWYNEYLEKHRGEE